MGRKAQGLFEEANVKTLLGVSGKIYEIIEQLVKGTLKERTLANPVLVRAMEWIRYSRI